VHNAGLTEDSVLELVDGQPIFIGFKMDTALYRQLQALDGPNKQYVSTVSSDFLRICRMGSDHYVGKLIHERLTTERVEDVRRNVLSILTRLCPETRLPQNFEILACGPEEPASEPIGERVW